jgi:O-antigen ligase
MLLALMAVLVWVPIPLASNRIWAWSILLFTLSFMLLVHTCYHLYKNQPLIAARWHYGLLIPLCLFLFYQILQYINPLHPFVIVEPLQSFTVGSIDPYQTKNMIFKTLAYSMFVYLVLQYCTNENSVKKLMFAVLVSACFQATYGSIINLIGYSHSPFLGFAEGGRARGSFVYQNHFANYLALALSLAIGWLVSELKTQHSNFSFKQLLIDMLNMLISKKMLLRLAIIIMIIGLILSRSRMGNAAFFSALMITGLVAIFIYRRPPVLLKPLILSLFVLDMVIIGSMFGLEKLQQRIEDTSFSAETRDEVVLDSIPIINKYWLTGTGAGTFYTVFPAYQPRPYSGFYDHAHNEYVQFSVEYGLVITALLGLWVMYALWLAARTMALRESKLYKGVAFGCCMAIIHMLIHNTVDFNLQSPSNTLLFLLIISLCHIVRYLPKQG